MEKVKYVTELENLDLDAEKEYVFYGLMAPKDEEIFLMAPENIIEVSLLADMEEDVLSQQVVDSVIALSLSNIGVILDIPFDIVKKYKDFKFDDGETTLSQYLIRFSVNSGATISYLPPKSGNRDDFTIYKNFLGEVAKDVFSNEGLDKEVYPVSNHIQFIINEIASNGKLEKLMPNDEYMITRFLESCTEEESNYFKEGIKEGLVDLFGDEKVLEFVILYIVSGILGQVESNLKNSIPLISGNKELFEQVNNFLIPDLKEKVGIKK